MRIVDALINSAAVWFVLKTIEVLPTAVYDINAAIKRCRTARDTVDDHDDGAYYDTRRGKLEYIFSGTHFGDLSLLRRSKKWLLISTLIPVIVFVLELMSIFLGYETRNCEASSDPDIVSAPGLELFGQGLRQTTIEIQLQKIFDEPLGRPCAVWSSSNSGVEYRSTICTNLDDLFSMSSLLSKFFPSSNFIRIVMPKTLFVNRIFSAVVFAGFSGPREQIAPLGVLTFLSEVLVNGKNILYRNITSTGVISEKIRQELREDVRLYEDLNNLTHSEYYDIDKAFGFDWDTVDQFPFRAVAFVQAVLAQATRGSIQTVTEMSSLSTRLRIRESIDISCQEDYVLPRIASITIIVIAILIRLLLIALPTTLSSVEFTLDGAQEMATPEDWSVFFMDRKRVICRRERLKG